jgi:hypothetical protein
MDEIRRTIMNEFADETCCDMFIMVLKQKWPEFDGDLKGRMYCGNCKGYQ